MRDTCEWVRDSDGCYQTGCKRGFECMHGDIAENHFTHCPYCGGAITELPSDDEEGDDER